MPTPVLIVGFNGFNGSSVQNGPYQDTTTNDLYVTLFDPVTFQIHVYRSTDDGLTWAPQDDGGAPVAIGFADNSPTVYDPVARTITVLLDPDPTFVGLLSIFQFSTATNTWGVAHVSPNYVAAGITFNGLDKMALRSGGDFVIFFSGFDGFGVNSSYFTTWNPIGGWLAVQVSLTPIIDDVCFAMVAAGVRVHVFSSNTGVNNLLHRTIHGDNSFTATDVVTANCVTESGGPPDFGVTEAVITFNVGLNELAMAILTTTGAFHSLVATEAETPVWVETDLGQTYDPGGGGFINTNTVALSVGANIFVYRIMGPSPFTIVQVELGGATTIELPAAVPQPQRFNVGLIDAGAFAVYNLDPAGGTAPSETLSLKFSGGPPPPVPGVASSLSPIGVLAGGTAQDVIPILPEKRLRRASQLLVDLQPSSNTKDLWIEIALRGVKLYRKGAHYHVDRSQRWRVKEFTYPTILPAGAPGTTFLKQTVVLDSDCAFLLYSVYSTQIVVAGYSFKFYGPNGEDLEYCLAYAGSAGPQPSLIGGGNTVGTSRRPRTFDPPVEYPPAGAITFDYRIPNPAPPNDSDRPMYLCFTGLRLYGRF